jgi:hypothetical protein
MSFVEIGQEYIWRLILPDFDGAACRSPSLGDVGDRVLQRRILLDCLGAADVTAPGTIRTLPYRWTKDDLRERQLQKKAP